MSTKVRSSGRGECRDRELQQSGGLWNWVEHKKVNNLERSGMTLGTTLGSRTDNRQSEL
jgi:hypothetical protein